MAKTPQQAYRIAQAKQAAKTAGHQARRDIDLQHRAAARKQSRQEQSARKKFEGSIPIWGAKDPDTGEHVFRPGAKQGFWEGRPNDEGSGWIGTQRGAAEGQSSWTKVHPANVERRPNQVGFLTGKVFGAIGNFGATKPSSGLPAQGQPLPPPVMPPGLPPRAAPAGGGAGGGVPAGAPAGGQQGQPMQHHWLNVKPGSGLPSGGVAQAQARGALGTGQMGLPSSRRAPGQPRVLTGQRPALGTGSPALGRGPVIDATSRSVPSNVGGKTLKGGTGTYMENEYGVEGDEGEHADWAKMAQKRIAFAVDPKNKIPRVDTRTSGGQREAQEAKYNAAWARSGTSMPSVYADDD
jgi:hypothetical protein